MTKEVVLFGAEKQSAVSIAMAYPEEHFVFVTTEPVIDGWDLPNVTILSLETFKRNAEGYRSNRQIVLNAKFYYNTGLDLETRPGLSLIKAFDSIKKKHSKYILKLCSTDNLPPKESWIVKGNLFHKPDATEIIKSELPVFSDDVYGCQYVFQQKTEVDRVIMITGNRNSSGGILLSMFHVLRESNAREDVLLACESIHIPEMEQMALQIVKDMDYSGFFSFNIVENKDAYYITSFRPEPKAVFNTLKSAGYDFLNYSGSDVVIVKSGLKFIADINYTSYKNLK